MKTKLVLWGENASNEKILLALELMERENKVLMYVFPLDVATEAFYQSLMNNWTEGKPLDFPQPYQLIERPLSISENLLPDDIKVERTDVINRAQAEWHFVVLSSKLYEMYQTELDEIKEKIDQLSQYDDKLWGEAKTFWTKVQDQVRDQNLFKEHSNILKERTNNLFEKLKELRKSFVSEAETISKEVAANIISEINEVKEKLDKGLGLKPLFERMKEIQTKYYQSQLTREDKKTVWDQLDGTFKAMKDRKPSGQPGGDAANRLKSRYDGLVDTIGKMEKSIQRDRQDLDFQQKKISTTDGQLEMQIRQAKLKILEERISSKDEKLQDMYKVKKELEAKLSKDDARKARDEKRTEAKEHVKQKIAGEIKAAEEERETMADLLEDAANKIKEGKVKKSKAESLLDAVTTTISETIEDVVDTAKAVASVVSEKAGDVAEDLEDKVEDAMDAVENKVDDLVDSFKKDDDTKEDDSTEEETGSVDIDTTEEKQG